MAQLQQPCLVPGCPETLVGLRGLVLKVCQPHREALAVDVAGDPFRYCMACKTFHPLDEFSIESHVCQARQAMAWQAHCCIRSRVRSRKNGGRLVSAQFNVLTYISQAMKVLSGKNNAEAGDAGKRVWGSSAFAFLRGETSTAQASLSVLYSVAVYGLGLHKPTTWVVATVAFATLQLLLPHTHQQHYVRPLQEVREAAAQAGLTVSALFRFLDPAEQSKYEQSAACSSVLWCVLRTAALLATNAVFSNNAVAAARVVWGVPLEWAPAALSLAGGVYLLLKMYWVFAAGLARLAHWMDASTLILVYSMPPIIMGYAWMSGAMRCGMPGSFLAGSNELISVAALLAFSMTSMVCLAMLVDGPVAMVVAVMAATSALRVPTALLAKWCIEVETGMATSFVGPAVGIAIRLTGSAVCVGQRVRLERSRMLSYLSQLQAKKQQEDATAGAEPLDSRTFHEGDRFLTLAVKMGNITPAELPVNLRERLLSTIQALPVTLEGAIYPGCVLLGLQLSFSSARDRQSALMSLMSHSDWQQTLLGSTDSAIDLNIQGSMYRVQDGRLQSTALGSDCPSIASVEPLAPTSDHRTLTLRLSGLGGKGFTALLRCGGHYHPLEVLEISPAPSGVSTAIVRLPKAAMEGLGWLEIVLDDNDDIGLVMSEAFPVLFTPLREVSEELSRVLPPYYGAHGGHGLAGLLGDIADCLHGRGAATPPHLLLQVAKLGMTVCFNHLANSRKALLAAEQQGQGLLGAAVLSDSVKMLDLVMSTLEDFDLPVDPCMRANDARGYTALHWAADATNFDLICTLLATTPDPRKAWEGCRARLCGKTPAELMAAYGSSSSIPSEMFEMLATDPELVTFQDDDVAGNPDAEAVLGLELAAACKQHPKAVRLLLGVLYAAIVAHHGWQDPSAWWVVGLTFALLELAVPYIYCEVYLKGLEECRRLAAERGLALSPSLRLLGAPEEQQRYKHFVAERTSKQILSRALLMLVAVIVSTVPACLLFEHFGGVAAHPGAARVRAATPTAALCHPHRPGGLVAVVGACPGDVLLDNHVFASHLRLAYNERRPLQCAWSAVFGGHF
eukprot:CAMPEP_0117657682 /NCGR_PEP_ID=MMETSP0804-20121206/5460_1 /TAXON_ID=1074897 /ORGANISM="Tetraselmis astigmatica, Strain CCMP880" /LENGTH=1072 /DNA_ID=CAMNT_0005464151 /DNA_START=43 /DNA_END=3260 /DNA_ORIENTATION=+